VSHSKKYLICYDIRDQRRLRHVHRTIRDFGTPVQFSVFEAELNQCEMDMLRQSLLKVIDLDQDRVSFYPLSPGYQKIHLGVIEPVNDLLLI
jgi:CRISPR-associated protein Cas2